MSGRARLDKIAAKLPPARKPEPAPGAFRADVPEPVREYLDRRIASLMPPDATCDAIPLTQSLAADVGRRLAADPACADIFRAIVRAASWQRRAPTLEEVQSAMLTGAGSRLAALLEGREYRPPDPYRVEMCHSALAWEVLFADSASFGASSVYCLDGPALVEHWRRTRGTDDEETLQLIGFGPAELALLSAKA